MKSGHFIQPHDEDVPAFDGLAKIPGSTIQSGHFTQPRDVNVLADDGLT